MEEGAFDKPRIQTINMKLGLNRSTRTNRDVLFVRISEAVYGFRKACPDPQVPVNNGARVVRASRLYCHVNDIDQVRRNRSRELWAYRSVQ